MRPEIASVYEMIEKVKAKSVLDIGCGRENLEICEERGLEKTIKERSSDIKYACVDIGKSADVILDLNKIEKLPFEDNSFDVIVLSHILEHLYEPKKILKEAVRVSKKWIIVGLPNDFAYSKRFKLFIGKNILPYVKYGHKFLVHLDDLNDFLELRENNLEIVQKKYIFSSTGGRFLPEKFRQFLAHLYPKLFAGCITLLLKIEN